MKKTKEIKVKSSWSEITIKEWIIIQHILLNELLEIDEKLELIAINISNITQDELRTIKVADHSKIMNKVIFALKDPEKHTAKKEYIIGGKEFEVDINLNNVVSGQYYGATNIMKENNDIIVRMCKLLGIYIRPKGKKWGEFDYDENLEFLYNNLTADIGYSLGVFFYLIANKYMKASQSYLIKMKKKELKNK